MARRGRKKKGFEIHARVLRKKSSRVSEWRNGRQLARFAPLLLPFTFLELVATFSDRKFISSHKFSIEPKRVPVNLRLLLSLLLLLCSGQSSSQTGEPGTGTAEEPLREIGQIYTSEIDSRLRSRAMRKRRTAFSYQLPCIRASSPIRFDVSRLQERRMYILFPVIFFTNSPSSYKPKEKMFFFFLFILHILQ